MQFVVGKRVGTDFLSTRRIGLLKIDIKSDSIRGKKKSVENMWVLPANLICKRCINIDAELRVFLPGWMIFLLCGLPSVIEVCAA